MPCRVRAAGRASSPYGPRAPARASRRVRGVARFVHSSARSRSAHVTPGYEVSRVSAPVYVPVSLRTFRFCSKVGAFTRTPRRTRAWCVAWCSRSVSGGFALRCVALSEPQIYASHVLCGRGRWTLRCAVAARRPPRRPAVGREPPDARVGSIQYGMCRLTIGCDCILQAAGAAHKVKKEGSGGT